MAERTPGPFEYFATTGAAIGAAADGPEDHSRTLATLAGELDVDASRASAATEGDISTLVDEAPRKAGGVARSLAQKGFFATACLRKFARHVDLFDLRVDQLNMQVSEAAAAEQTDLAKVLLEPLSGPKAASDAKYRELLPQYRRAQADLDDTADQVAGWLQRGPTDRLLHRLVRSGLMPLEAAGAFPELELTPSDRYLALAAEAAKGLIPPEILAQGPRAIDDYLAKHHDIASKLTHKNSDSDLPGILLAPTIGVGGTRGGDVLTGTSPAERRRLALLLPSVFGNNPDAPFDMRSQANRVRISGQIHDDQQEIKRLNANRPPGGPGSVSEQDGIDDRIDQLRDRGNLYDHLLNDVPAGDKDGRAPDHRSVILFDPSGDGSMAELHGVLDEKTQNVGVYVPGTGHGLDDWDASASRSNGFVRNSRELAGITWIGGDLPDSVIPDAGNQRYAKLTGPMLSDFSHQVRDEVDRQGSDAVLKYLGHSYGGAIVGQAEHHGLDADGGVLMVEGAGMGPVVHDIGDLHTGNQNIPHYSMTAPGDPIALVQSNGHLGADPDTFGNATRLQTGSTSSGDPIHGPSSHGGVFEPKSDAWGNMLAFLNGRSATLRHDNVTVHVDPDAEPVEGPSYDSGGTVRIR